MNFLETGIELEELDQFSFDDVRTNGTWNRIRYPVNARLEFELLRTIDQQTEQEVRDRFKPRIGRDQDIHVDWTQFHGVYIPACYLELKLNPEACMGPFTLEYIRKNNPKSLKDGTCTGGLFARDDLNSIYPKLLSKSEAEDAYMRRNIRLGEIVYGDSRGIDGGEKIKKLFEDREWRGYATECTRAMLECALSLFEKYGKDIRDGRLRRLIGMLITRYQEEIGKPQIVFTK